MKYDRFLGKYPVTKIILGNKPIMNDDVASKGINELPMAVYSNGIYTIVNRDEAATLTKIVESVFPFFAGKIAAFAIDWMGRIFAADSNSPDSTGSATISCFDLAEPSSFCTDANFDDFHEFTAIDMALELFNLDQFAQWTSKNAPPNDGESCIGYKIPLFLGGLDTVENMERSDRAVYLHLLSELFSSAK